MLIEKSFYAATLKEIKNAGGYRRVYFGAEFCQWRMPGPVAAARAFEYSSDAGMGFSLLTPPVTDEGLRRLARVLRALEEAGGAGAEVVINDYGTLSLLEGTGFVPVLGRLLTKQKICPRAPAALAGMPEAGREIYMHASAQDPVFAAFLRKKGIKRAELDNPLQGIGVNLKKARLKGTLYVPYAYATTTRWCPASFDGGRWQSLTGCRLRGCLKNVIELSNPAHEAPLIMRGNAQFVRNDTAPDGLAGMGIDRIVFMERVP